MHVTFYAHGVAPEIIERNEFYRQDVHILRSLGAIVTIATRISDLPKHSDLILVWWWNWLWLIGPVARLHKWPICVTGTFDDSRFLHRPFLERRLVQFGLRFADWNVFVSEYMYLRAMRLAHFKNASFCPHIISEEYVIRTPRNNLRKREVIFNVSWKNQPNMLRKMIPELIQAFALVKQIRTEAQLVLAGAPVDGQRLLEKQVTQLGIGASVSFLGVISRAEKIRRMQECGAYVQCSRYEGFGVAIGEAMACGAPVVVNRSSSIPEIVGDCGFYVSADTPDAIAESLLQVMANPAASQEIGVRAAKRINELFRFNRRRDHFARILKQAEKHSTNK